MVSLIAEPRLTLRRLLFLGAFPQTSFGSRAVSEDVAAELEAAGWDVHLASRRRGRVTRVADLFVTMLRRYRRCDVAVVDVYSGQALRWAEMAAATLNTLRVPIVLCLHGGNLPQLFEGDPARMARLLQRAARVTAPSAYLRDAALPARADIDLVPNGLGLARYPYRPRASAAPRLVWLRAFHEIYRPHLAVEALAQIVRSYPDAHLTMIGPDKDGTGAATRELAVSRGLANQVTFTGGIPKGDVGRYLSEADIFVNTTSIDNMPVSVIEAAACGLCIVSTNVGGIPHLLTHGDDALLVPPDDAGALASAIRSILDDPARAASLSAAARVTAEQFDWRPVVARWEHLLTEVVSSHRQHTTRVEGRHG